MTYELRKEGRTFCQWTTPALTPPPDVLRGMKQNGYRLYVDGKLKR